MTPILVGVTLITPSYANTNNNNTHITSLQKKSNVGNINAQFELAKLVYDGHSDIKAQLENGTNLFLILANNNYTCPMPTYHPLQ